MTDEPNSHLRNRPRQARSAARVEHLLDVAEEIFEEVGYDAATTNLVASRAGVPVGTLYRWFPDKSALAEALTDRYLDHLVSLYQDLLSDIAPDVRIGDFVRRVMNRLADETLAQRAMPALLVSAMVPGGRSRAGVRLREGLEGHISALLELRVPGIPDDLRDRSSEVLVTLVYLVLAAAADSDNEHRREVTDEYIDVVLAYLEAKFPSPDHPSWTDPDVPVRPLFAAPDLARRLAAARDS
ncbi:MAG TPA: TetR/AcrR family transcriptional regulator [Acidimicrobiales bacterium]|nr:TetR/AcrR family transcriptional regulator [Acidimicrobiales bacterium]HMS88955.1 TetR/AcrR family transcriptional regulator [Acidimicrobiales bacterium]HRA34860.1 TetR/AcrR family transcriptional regulator [Acidimicrobiales bacterium]